MENRTENEEAAERAEEAAEEAAERARDAARCRLAGKLRAELDAMGLAELLEVNRGLMHADSRRLRTLVRNRIDALEDAAFPLVVEEEKKKRPWGRGWRD